MTEFKMPSLGADMEAGRLVEWRVKPGDPIKRGDIIAVVETDKAAIEVESFVTGTVDRLIAEPGERLSVGAVMAEISTTGVPQPATVPEPAAAAAAAPASTPEGQSAAAGPLHPRRAPETQQPSAVAAERVRASPLARRRARELGVDLSTVRGSGPHGVIEAADVESPGGAATAVGGMRRAIAAAMSRSNREIPHYYLETSIDLDIALRRLGQLNQTRSIRDRVLPAALLLKAVATALKSVPDLNAYWIDDRLHVQPRIHLGIAISLRQGGLLIPAIHDVDRMSVPETMAALADLIERTRAGRLRSSEVTDGTITVTNLGDLGVETVFGVIYPPQVALVGFGRIAQEPCAVAGTVGIRPMVRATLAGDHRATDGRRGAQFLTALGRALQEPENL
jgi:pyruvate dehydrogenase E2 component (dihydrolipoamide acetyltransferase)